jgi:hypothetical protein
LFEESNKLLREERKWRVQPGAKNWKILESWIFQILRHASTLWTHRLVGKEGMSGESKGVTNPASERKKNCWADAG